MQITKDELRTLFLFAALNDDQLGWLAEHGRVVSYEAGAVICQEGERATCFLVLLDGEIALSNLVRGDRVETLRSDQRGAYAGATQAYITDGLEQLYRMTVEATRPTSVLELPAEEFGPVIREWFPMAIHLLEGLFYGMNRTRQRIDQRERMASLGIITAGLTHELNNPAAAAARSADELGERIAKTGVRLAELAGDGIDGDHVTALVRVRDKLAGRPVPKRRALEVTAAEDELADWLEDHGVDDGYDLAPDLLSGGMEIEDGEMLARKLDPARLPAAVRYLANDMEIVQLQREISDAVRRISDLLDKARQYSQVDRASFQTTDLRELLDSTLTMLSHKLKGITVVREYDQDLPDVPVYPADLNQVWTNMIVNAIQAMHHEGTLTVGARRENDHAVVEFGDTGDGIPPENLDRIFTPFFTTKDVGEGTGLGLDISRQIVVGRHHGDITVESKPGDTRFQIRLPIKQA